MSNISRVKKVFFFSILILVLVLAVLFRLFFSSQYRAYNSLSDIPDSYSALILGAGLNGDGSPSPILEDRVEVGVMLLRAGKVKKLILSGDNRVVEHDEPGAMYEYALSLGVAKDQLVLDYAGRRTYDSCKRAKEIFSQGRLVVVTQSFHMDRALFLCNSLGIETVGFISDRKNIFSCRVSGLEANCANKLDETHYNFSNADWFLWSLRDRLAMIEAVVDIYVFHPSYVGGEKINI